MTFSPAKPVRHPRRKPYTVASLRNALEHHQRTGAVRTWWPPQPDQTRWTVQLDQGDHHELTERQVYALCLGLASGARSAIDNDDEEQE